MIKIKCPSKFSSKNAEQNTCYFLAYKMSIIMPIIINKKSCHYFDGFFVYLVLIITNTWYFSAAILE